MSVWVGVFFFIVYLFTSAPLVYLGDSGGLTAAAYSLGPAHPPGYFLYVMLGKLASFAPFGNIAQRLSLLSALFSAISAGVVFRTVFIITKNNYAAFFSVSITFLSYLFWSQSVIPEVYTLNLLIAVSVFYLTVSGISKPESTFKCVLLSLFLIGLGTANHHTVLLMAAAPVYVFITNFRHIADRFRLVGFSFLFFITGCLANLGVYLRGQKDILYNHSIAQDLPGFIAVILRKHYAGDTISAIGAAGEPSGWLRGVINSFSFVFSDTWCFIPILVLGIVRLIKADRKILYLSLLLCFLWAFLLGSITVSADKINPEQRFITEVYFIPLYLPLSVLLGAGFSFLTGIFRMPESRLVGKSVLLSIAVVPLLIMFPKNYPKADLTENTLGYYYAQDMLSVPPPKSILVTGGDNSSFTASYLKAVERYREDVILAGAVNPSRWFLLPVERGVRKHPLYQDFYDRGSWITANELDDLRRDGYNVFFTHEETLGILKRDYSLLFYGPLFKVVPKDSLKDELRRTEGELASVMDRTNYEALMEVPDPSKDYFSWVISYQYSEMLLRYGYIKEEKDTEEAIRYYEAAYRLSPVYDKAKSIYEDALKKEKSEISD